MNNLYRHTHRSASRFFLNMRTNSNSVASTCIPPHIDTNAKVIYSLAPAMGHHKEQPLDTQSIARLPVILNALEKAKLTPEFRGSEIIQLESIRTATLEDIASVHSRYYLDSIERAVELAKTPDSRLLGVVDSRLRHVTPTTFEDSLVAAGVGQSLVDSVVASSKISDNPPVGFALIQPPLHHSVVEGSTGCCYFGNVAIAARYAQRVHGLKRVFIIDFDVHYVNETSNAFYDDPDIFFLSTHQEGGSKGKFNDIGRGNGEGATLNLPLPKCSGDTAMRNVFDEIIAPAALRFKPDIILVSAGYDGHAVDPLGTFQLTTGTYYMLASSIMQLAKDLCGGRCVFFLEGGYNLGIVSFSVAESFRAFIGEPSMAPEYEKKYAAFLQDEPSDKIKRAIQMIKLLHSLQ